MNYLSVLPMALVMIAGAQLACAISLARRPGVRGALGYLAGAAGAVLLGVTVAYWAIRLIKNSAGGGGSRSRTVVETAIDVVVFALVGILIILVALGRRRSRPAGWMGWPDRPDPEYPIRLGLLLFLLTPVDAIVIVTVAASMVRYDRPWWHLLPFVALTLLLAAAPLLARLLLGGRAQPMLRRLDAWAAGKSWLVSEFALVFFLCVVISPLIG